VSVAIDGLPDEDFARIRSGDPCVSWPKMVPEWLTLTLRGVIHSKAMQL